MPLYNYRARDGASRAMAGTVESPGEREALLALRNRGLFVTSLELNKDMRATAATRPRRVKPVGLRELAMFCRQFGTMLAAGVTILSALRALEKQTRQRSLKHGLAEVAADINGGESLTNAFRRQEGRFPLILQNMVAAGEVGGILEGVFERLAAHFDKEHAVSQKVRTALIYPVVVSSVAVIVVSVMVTVVLPKFVAMFGDLGAALPPLTLALIGLSDFLRKFWWAVFGGAAMAVSLTSHWSRTSRGRASVDKWSLKLPFFGAMLLKRAVSRFARTLGTLLQSGVPVLVSLAVVERTLGNVEVGRVVAEARARVREGQSMTAPLAASGVFPPMVTEMMVVGEETGAMEEMLLRVADFYDQEVSYAVDRLTAMMEPLIIIVLATVIGTIVVALILPMFDMFQHIGP